MEQGNSRGKIYGEEQIREDQAARERGDDRARGPWEDDADGGDDARAGEEVRRGGEEKPPKRRPAGGERGGGRKHNRARGVSDGETPLHAQGRPRGSRHYQKTNIRV